MCCRNVIATGSRSSVRVNKKERDKQALTQPVVDPKPRDPEPDKRVGPSESVAEINLHESVESNANVAQDNELGVLLLVQRASRVEVIDTSSRSIVLALAAPLTLALVEVVTGNIGHEVVGPSNKLLSNKHGESEDGGLFGKLRDLVKKTAHTLGVVLTGARNKNHIALHVSCGLVVLAVRNLPAEVGYKQRRVKEPASDIVDHARRRESSMTTLMGNDPETCAEEPLHGRVQSPKGEAGRLAGDVVGSDEVVEDVKCRGETGHIAEDISPATNGRSFKAVLGNGIANVLDRVVRRREVVAVGVDEVGVLGLGLSIDVDRRK